MIIGFCGRMRAGKSTLSEVCEKNGFIHLAFADQLKGLCADLLDISTEELNRIKNDETRIDFSLGNKDVQTILSDETGIALDDVKSVCDGQVIKTARELLQYVGTELIRKYNPDWHVERTRAIIDPNLDYVIDDVRFKNEKKMIEDLGGICWFIMRPTIHNISRHASENDIKWQDCWNHVIVNDIPLKDIKFKWECILDDYETSLELRDDLLKSILDTSHESDSDTLDIANLMLLTPYFLTYKTPEIKSPITAAEMASDSSGKHILTVELEDGTKITTHNPLEIEDLKFELVKSDVNLF